jgi:hypothetical protein
MITATVTFELTILYFVAANVIGILAYVLYVKYQARRHLRHTRLISKVILAYLRITEVKVSVKCISPEVNKNFIAFIESEPMKRFRLSHLVEATLRDHVRATCGLELDRVYWRFIVKEKMAEGDDEYMRESLRSMVHSKYEISDGSLEMFEEASKSAGYRP